MMQAIAKYFPAGTRATRPVGGYFLWVELPERIDALEIHRLALSHGISIAPGPIFSSHGHFRNCLRLNFGHPWDARMNAGLATLGKLICACFERRRPIISTDLLFCPASESRLITLKPLF